MDSSGKQEEKERDRVDSGNDGEIYLYDERTAWGKHSRESVCVNQRPEINHTHKIHNTQKYIQCIATL